ncbi:MAG TPA: BTAD domain-containing putative transcriptional regulator [Actinomycetes bacterium]|nr:BTAD domain-containing putative transcriptional regulator [Actinomycetes bacterium]
MTSLCYVVAGQRGPAERSGGTMAFVAKSAMPHGPRPAAEHPVLDEAAASGRTVLTPEPGYLLSEGLSTAFTRQGRSDVVWVRLGPEDRDPGLFLASLIAAMQRTSAGFGRATLELMRAQPGPVAGWPPAFARMAEELAEALPATGALVLEHAHHLDDGHPTLGLVGRHLLPALPAQLAVVVTSHRDLPPAALPGSTARLASRDLRIAPAAARAMLERAAPGLSGDAAARAAALCRGQAATLDAVASACTALGPRLVQQRLAWAGSAGELLRYLADAWLFMLDAQARRFLGLMLEVEYGHPTLTGAALGGGAPPPGPWLQALADGWSRIRTVWRAPLRSAPTLRHLPSGEVVRRTADRLTGMGATERAIPLYLRLGDPARAAEVMAGEADRLMDLGQWETLGGWLDRLPGRVLNVEPRLLYHHGEIAAASGRSAAARDRFSTAASLFVKRHDPEGACRSMLAESALALGQDDLAHARARALAASALADGTGLPRHQAWASWQLGTLASRTGDLEDARTYFGRAVTAASRVGERVLTDVVAVAERLARRVQELEHERDRHYSALLALEGTIHEAAMQLRGHLDTARVSGTLVDAYGWSQTPLPFKPVQDEPPGTQQPGQNPPGQGPSGQEPAGWWSKVRRVIVPQRDAVHTREFLGLAQLQSAAVSFPPEEGDVGPADEGGVGPVPPAPAGRGAPTLTVHLLGPLRVTLNQVPVTSWPSGRGRALLKYLLTHRAPWPAREVLMEVFWPDSTPEAARNSLNVAVHGLRRALRAAADAPVVVLEGGAYRLHADVGLWLDIDEFERHVASGRQLEETGELTGAIAEYELAASVYQGDFLADDPYEEWSVLSRERLRLEYLDTLDRLSQLYFGQGSYASCAALCRRIIERDSCREDAHRRLMRCYSRQGQPHLALRQYQACAEALRGELGVEPDPATVALNEQIRLRRPV